MQRAARYPISARVLWRPQGTPDWLEAVSLNASRTGVLFETEHVQGIGTEVELIFAFAWDPEAGTTDEADVLCLGRIVRTERRSPQDTMGLIGAAIESYSFIAQP